MRFVETLKNIWTIEELRTRLLVTLLLVLVYRLGCYVVLPGISPDDLDALSKFTNKSGAAPRYVLGWRILTGLDFRPGYHALHHGVDRYPASWHGASLVPENAARGRERPSET